MIAYTSNHHLTIACISLLLAAQSSHAFLQPEHERLPNFDIREQQSGSTNQITAKGSRSTDSAVQTKAKQYLQTNLPDFRISLDPQTGSPRHITSPDGFLTGPHGKGSAISAHALQSESLTDPDRVIKAFVNEHAALFGHGADHLGTAILKRDHENPRTGMRTVVRQQQLNGIPMFQALFVYHLSENEELISIESHFIPAPDTGEQASEPTITAEEAVAYAANTLRSYESEQTARSTAIKSYAVTPMDSPQGTNKKQHFSAAGLNGTTETRLTWLPMNRSDLRLCWQVILTDAPIGEMFSILIDAESGETMIRHSLTEYLSDATYRVYTSDSPSPLSPGHDVPNSAQPPLIERELVTIDALSPVGSPLGWITDGMNQTQGNNVDAHLDRDADNEPDPGSRPTGAPLRVFDFPLDLTLPPENYQEAAVVQLFYWNNRIHDALYDLGFTEAAGNFQNSNFGRGGLGNDAVLADAQDGSGSNNANFASPPDGIPGRMQMFIFDGPDPDRDGDLDAEVIIHEYCHGLSNRRVGNGSYMTKQQSRGMGEGWSDFFSIALLSEPEDDVNGNYVEGGYLSYQASGLTENYYYGIRRYPYSTDRTKNPLTFKDLDPDQADPHEGIPKSPHPSDSASQVHNMGEVWCVTLWDARANLINKHGFEFGNKLILQLVYDGLGLCPENPTYLEARDAILLADRVNNDGANLPELWSAFMKRGMGFSARAPSSGTTSGIIEAYDPPDDLRIAPTKKTTAIGRRLGPIAPDPVTYQISNFGTSSLPWSVSCSAAWIDLSSTGGELAPGEMIDLTATLNATAYALSPGVYSSSFIFQNMNSAVLQTREISLRIETFYTLPFFEDFESGMLDPRWIFQGTSQHRTQVTTEHEPHSGLYHLTMDTTADGDVYSRNELTLNLNLAYHTNVVLNFWVKDFEDSWHWPPDIPFEDEANFDGVAISVDGIYWYEVQGLRIGIGENYTNLTVNVDEAMMDFGLTYDSTFWIRFCQYDNFSIPVDGIAFDNISITGDCPDEDYDELPDVWEICHFGIPGNCIAENDPDQDGASNLQEFFAGTDPTDPSSVFAITTFEKTADQHRLTWPPVAGRTYSIYWTPDLQYVPFAPIATDLYYPLDSMTDQDHTAEDRCFYKLEVEQQN